ncbi:hypothetical protein INR49_004948 [Caranx melampygus]|nr:hypothetical protein INR49_004948 [Caranx melampygus]
MMKDLLKCGQRAVIRAIPGLTKEKFLNIVWSTLLMSVRSAHDSRGFSLMNSLSKLLQSLGDDYHLQYLPEAALPEHLVQDEVINDGAEGWLREEGGAELVTLDDVNFGLFDGTAALVEGEQAVTLSLRLRRVASESRATVASDLSSAVRSFTITCMMRPRWMWASNVVLHGGYMVGFFCLYTWPFSATDKKDKNISLLSELLTPSRHGNRQEMSIN